MVMKMFGVLEKLSITQQTTFISEVHGLVPKFVNQGYLTDGDLEATDAFKTYNRLGLNANTTVAKDRQAISRQRCVILNHDMVLQLQGDRERMKEAEAQKKVDKKEKRETALAERQNFYRKMWWFLWLKLNAKLNKTQGVENEDEWMRGDHGYAHWMSKRMIWNIVRRYKSTAKRVKYCAITLRVAVVAKPKKNPGQPKQRKRKAVEASLNMPDDGKQFQQVRTSSGRMAKRLIQK